jgi:hypothetical protein
LLFQLQHNALLFQSPLLQLSFLSSFLILHYYDDKQIAELKYFIYKHDSLIVSDLSYPILVWPLFSKIQLFAIQQVLDTKTMCTLLLV